MNIVVSSQQSAVGAIAALPGCRVPCARPVPLAIPTGAIDRRGIAPVGFIGICPEKLTQFLFCAYRLQLKNGSTTQGDPTLHKARRQNTFRPVV